MKFTETNNAEDTTKNELIEKARELLDKHYPERDAEYDEEIAEFRKNSLQNLNELQNKNASNDDIDKLKEFVENLERIYSPQIK